MEFAFSDAYKFEKLNNLSVNLFELSFYQEGEEWKQESLTIEISEIDWDRIFHLVINKNFNVPTKKLRVFLGKSFICRRCSNSFKNENTLIKRKQKCEQQEITSIKTSTASELYWTKYHNELKKLFRSFVNFEADNEIDTSNVGDETSKIYEQNTVCNVYCRASELNDVLQSV